MSIDAAPTAEYSPRHSRRLVGDAMHRSAITSLSGIRERVFSLAFSSLVYPQIWEDPVVDMEAMALAPGHKVVTIASGGCNVLSYLTAAPIDIVAVDLNAAHVALNKLKLAALTRLPAFSDFYRFFGEAESSGNVTAYDSLLARHLDPATRAYWEGRDILGRRRIEAFSRGFYKEGLLGRSISAVHLLARTLGADPRSLTKARSREEQRQIYEAEIRPLFDKKVIRALFSCRSSLFGLGIPPAQYDALAEGRPMYEVVEERLARLACEFDLKDNYFAWQAFHRGYAAEGRGPVPPYLQGCHFDDLRRRAAHVEVTNTRFTDCLAAMPRCSADRYVLLDAQDWMDNETLAALWNEITRTARPGARVIFRTAGMRTILPGRVPSSLLSQWSYLEDLSRGLAARDRSAIYGGFHLYVKKAS
jgi:S-adenosylmethionine-diacylglycerol 3-amino-3-carboxypropyl transferase